MPQHGRFRERRDGRTMAPGVILADYPTGTLTIALGAFVAVPIVGLCLFGAWAMRREKRQMEFRLFLIAACLFAAAWVGLGIAAQALDLP
jgi:hypothetical protein